MEPTDIPAADPVVAEASADDRAIGVETDPVRRHRRALTAIRRCNRALIGAENESDLLHEICRIVVEVAGYRFAWVGYAEHDAEKSVRPVARYGTVDDTLDIAQISWADTERGRGPTGTAIRTGRAVAVRNLASDPDFAPWRSRALALGFRSVIALPLWADGRPFGALVVYATVPDAFDTDETDLLSEFADDLAYGITALRTRAEKARAVEALAASEKRYRTLVESMNEGLLILDADRRITFVNPRFCEMIGYSAGEMIGRHVEEVHFDERERMDGRRWEKHHMVSHRSSFERTYRRKDGGRLVTIVSAQPMFDDGGRFVSSFGVVTDVTERKMMEEALADARIIVESSPMILYRMAIGGRQTVTYLSENISRFGYRAADFLTGRLIWRDILLPEDLKRVDREARERFAQGAERLTQQFRLFDAHGALRWVEAHHTVLRDAAGRLTGYQGLLTEITERKQAEERIAQLARFDSLTGLPNRHSFIERLHQEIARAGRGGSAFAVHFLDLDRFKDINDALGHAAGDQLLQAVATRLRATVRESDFVARLGGDEFAVLETGLKDATGAGILAQSLLTAFAAPFVLGDHEVHATTSIGIIVSTGRETEEPLALLGGADTALYRAKDDGGNRYRLYSDELDRAVRERVAIAEDLRAVLDRGGDELFLEYQPQVCYRSGQIIGLEALVRWRHPERGVLAPGAFIPVAEITGLVVPLGRWVLHEACRQMRAWLDQGRTPPRVAVNVSALHLKAQRIESDVEDALKAADLCPRYLEIEITETTVMDVSERNDDVLGRLRQRGITLAIDDFGTGHSSLAYLTRLRPDRLKIAQEFVRDVLHDTADRAIVRAIIDMAEEIGLSVLAEGVETAEQAKLLDQIGCREMQGFHFARPLPADSAKGF